MRRQELIDKNRAWCRTSTTTCSGKKWWWHWYATNGAKSTQKSSIELLRYPKDRVENDTDYLKLSIAQYVPVFFRW